MNTTLTVKCPYCKKVQETNEVQCKKFAQMQIFTCDNEVGGCDQKFVVKYFAQPQVKEFTIMGADQCTP